MKTQKFFSRARLSAGVAPVVLGLAMIAAPADAQEAQAAEEETATSEIVVTGSRLAQPNLDSASPITVISAEEVKFTGTTRVEDLVNSLPQVLDRKSVV